MLYLGFQVFPPEAGPCTGTFCPHAALNPCLVSRQLRRQARYHGRGDVAKRSEFEARKRAVAEAREARLHKDDPKVASGGRGFPDNPLLQARPVREPCLCSRWFGKPQRDSRIFSLRLLVHASRGQNVTAVQASMDLIIRNRNKTRCRSRQDVQRAQRAGGATTCWHTSWCRNTAWHGRRWRTVRQTCAAAA